MCEPKLEALIKKADALIAEIQDVLHEIKAVASGEETLTDHVKAFEAWYADLWKKQYGSRYMWAEGKGGIGASRGRIRALLKELAGPELATRVLRYLHDRDPRLIKAKHPFGWFDPNRYAGPRRIQQSMLDPDTWVCPHQPHCPSREACAVVTSRVCPHVPYCGDRTECLRKLQSGDWGHTGLEATAAS